jgi:enoyl-CoA hydratase
MLTIERQDRIAIVRFDRGDGKNALSLAALAALRDQFEALRREDDPPTAIVLTGAPGAFSVGFDLKDPMVQTIESASIPERLRGPRLGAEACMALAALEGYTIAAIEGWCLGGGLALALAADLVLAGSDARFGLPEIDRGLSLSWTALPRLLNRAGSAAGKRLAILGETVDAEMARQIGVVDEVVPSGGALARAMELAKLAAAKPPLALRMIKRGANAWSDAQVAPSALDAEQFALATLSEDFAESLEAFRAKRSPRFEGR